MCIWQCFKSSFNQRDESQALPDRKGVEPEHDAFRARPLIDSVFFRKTVWQLLARLHSTPVNETPKGTRNSREPKI